MTEKQITIGLDVKGKNFKHKAKHAITALKKELKKHFRNKEFVISPATNNFIWLKGRRNCPRKITLVSVERNNKVYLFLNTEEDLKKKDELISGKTSISVTKKAKPVGKVESPPKKEEGLTQEEKKVEKTEEKKARGKKESLKKTDKGKKLGKEKAPETKETAK